MHKQITCYSLRDFRSLEPRADVAVISIHDDGGTHLSLEGWGPSMTRDFTDVEYDREYVSRWGWSMTEQAGLFMPQDAVALREFIHSPAVSNCSGLAVHCYAGRSRSVAVGVWAQRILGWELVVRERAEPNKTVLALLDNPAALGEVAYAQDKESTVPRGLLARLWRTLRASASA